MASWNRRVNVRRFDSHGEHGQCNNSLLYAWKQDHRCRDKPSMSRAWAGPCAFWCGAVTCAGLSFAATGADSPAAGPSGAPKPTVDMAIEWVAPTRPSIAALPTGPDLAPITADLGPEENWTLSPQDRRLSVALQRWTAQAGWQLLWEAERDFPIEIEVRLQGTLSAVLQRIMSSLQDSDYPLQAVMNSHTRVLRVIRQREVRR